jgi:hypothetical protein
MSWEDEFGPEYDVPAAILDRVQAGLLDDVSWHNDVAPSFEIVGAPPPPKDEPEENTWRIFAEHPDPDEREFEIDRFTVSGPDEEYPGNIIVQFETDDVRQLWPWIKRELGVDMSLKTKKGKRQGLSKEAKKIKVSIRVQKFHPRSGEVEEAALKARVSIGKQVELPTITFAIQNALEPLDEWVEAFYAELGVPLKTPSKLFRDVGMPTLLKSSGGYLVIEERLTLTLPNVSMESFQHAANAAGMPVGY